MVYFFDCLWHFISSNSRHGTHSPFVYMLAEEAVYQGKKCVSIVNIEHTPAKYRCTLSRILDSLNVHTILLDGLKYNLVNIEEKKAIMVSAPRLSGGEFDQLLSFYDVVIVDEIYRNKHAKAMWQMVSESDEVTVSIDLFYFGLLFRRAGQSKEHFKLRFPFWLERRVQES